MDLFVAKAYSHSRNQWARYIIGHASQDLAEDLAKASQGWGVQERDMHFFLVPLNHRLLERLGLWFLNKWRGRLESVSTHQAALNMKKQGVPIEIALLVLAGRE